MKELSIEEKAKRYDVAIERAKEMIKAMTDIGGVAKVDDIQYLFPELKESEGDKELSEILGRVIRRYINDPNIPYTEREKVSMEIIPYVERLEKQGEQQDVSIQINPSEYINDMGGKGCYLKNFLKPVDEVKPKFKVGDWVFIEEVKGYKNGPFQINTVDSLGYSFDEYHTIPFMYEDLLSKWTIQDAKDGDVLYEYNEKKPFIFKELKTKHIDDIASYCDIFNGIFNTNEDSWTTLDIVPATKEQRELLFSKMIKAGYEWDAEKKELKKIEQKPWSEEDENNLNLIIARLHLHPNVKAEEYYKEYHWLKSLKDRYTWKPSDEMLDALYRVIPESVMEKSEDEVLLDKLYQGLKYGKVLSEK